MGDGHPEKSKAGMTSGPDGHTDIDLGEPDQGGQGGGTDPQKGGAAIRADRLEVGRDDDKAE
jgi:hypothetical protein